MGDAVGESVEPGVGVGDTGIGVAPGEAVGPLGTVGLVPGDSLGEAVFEGAGVNSPPCVGGGGDVGIGLGPVPSVRVLSP